MKQVLRFTAILALASFGLGGCATIDTEKQKEIDRKLGQTDRPRGAGNLGGFITNPQWEKEQRTNEFNRKQAELIQAELGQKLAAQAEIRKVHNDEIAKLLAELDTFTPEQRKKMNALRQKWDARYSSTGCSGPTAPASKWDGWEGTTNTEFAKDFWVLVKHQGGMKYVAAVQLPGGLNQAIMQYEKSHGYAPLTIYTPLIHWIHRYVFYDVYSPENIVCGLNGFYVRGDQKTLEETIEAYLSIAQPNK
jgi:hypothetical protein